MKILQLSGGREMLRQVRRARNRFQRAFETKRLERLTNCKKPANPKATVIFAGLTRNKFSRGGKVSAFEFLPVFANLLREEGFDTTYVTSNGTLEKAIDTCENAIVVMIYGEDTLIPDDTGLAENLSKAELVMHHPDIGRTINDKRAANAFFSAHGVPFPEMVQGAAASQAAFSNENNTTAATTYTVAPGDALDDNRYNTRFIDTRIEYDGNLHYATVRLMCVGPTITHCLVRSRPVSDGDATVHAKDTPTDPNLLLALHEKIVTPYMAEYADLAQAVYRAIGPGFYSHDVLLDASNNAVFMAETGFKFDDMTYAKHVWNIRNDLPFLHGFQTPSETARQSVRPFIDMVNMREDAR